MKSNQKKDKKKNKGLYIYKQPRNPFSIPIPPLSKH